MKAITSKTALNPLIEKAINTFEQKGEEAFVAYVHDQLLKSKIKFPLLEHVAEVFCKSIPVKHHYSIAEKIMHLDTIGGNVLVGILLRNRLEKDFKKAIDQALQHIVYGNLWYVCDIIGERVLGVALLTQPDKTIALFKKLSKHENNWVLRTIGVATHYAVKKGLKKKYVEEVFEVLLRLGHVTDFHTKKGIGWAVKTTAKFHPDIIQQYQKELSKVGIKTWFKTKIQIGLGRSDKYASRYNS